MSSMESSGKHSCIPSIVNFCGFAIFIADFSASSLNCLTASSFSRFSFSFSRFSFSFSRLSSLLFLLSSLLLRRLPHDLGNLRFHAFQQCLVHGPIPFQFFRYLTVRLNAYLQYRIRLFRVYCCRKSEMPLCFGFIHLPLLSVFYCTISRLLCAIPGFLHPRPT